MHTVGISTRFQFPVKAHQISDSTTSCSHLVLSSHHGLKLKLFGGPNQLILSEFPQSGNLLEEVILISANVVHRVQPL